MKLLLLPPPLTVLLEKEVLEDKVEGSVVAGDVKRAKVSDEGR